MAERLWAPWRFEYVGRAGSTAGCIFVDLPGEDQDERNHILFRGRTAFVILNAFPYTNGHLMVAPYRHTAEMNDLTNDELLEVNQLVAACLRWIRHAYQPDGFNVGINLGHAGGAGIPSHIHWHIVPRWVGDTNFMTTVGDVRVMPEGLDSSYARLKRIAESDPPRTLA